MKRMGMKVILLGALCLNGFYWGSVSAATPEAADGSILFTLKVKPLLVGKCLACHGEQGSKIKGGLDLSTREGFLQGGDEHSDTLVSGSPRESFVMKAVRWEDPDVEMPPKENDRLAEEQIEWLRRWIELGAPWPTEQEQEGIRLAERKQVRTEEGVLVTTSGGTAGEWTYRRYRDEDIWAFQSVNTPTPPKTQSGVKNPIDALVRARLDDAGFDPAPLADAVTLIRRASLDLLGLPPSPKEIVDFSNAWAKDTEKAWGDLIDRLLASPHYGERWGQHWLDVVRYADTGGYSNDYERSNAWRYRDYVIRSFNEDKPYDEFVVEQLAGDELWEDQPDANKDPELLVATGFLRMGPWDPAMVKAPEARQLFIDDVVNAVGETFLSTTMRCFKCHDHKFDPLPTRDYYRFYAAFAGTQMAERPAPFLEVENREGFEYSRVHVERLRSFAIERKNLLIEKRESAARKWFEENGLDYVSHQDRKTLPDEEKPPRHVGLDAVDQGRLKVREQDEWIWNRRLERFEGMVQSVYNGADPSFLNARKLRMPKNRKQDWRPDSRILIGGTLQAPGEKVLPGVLSATAVPVSLSGKDPYVIDESLDGRRLALANWIAHPENPLTARSIVNRVWGYHFGKGLAGNPNNFGAKGSKPTHPKLLDWLASDFVSRGWTLKRLHRLIMTSQTYLQSGRHPSMDMLNEEDPSNGLIAYFPVRRLTAEELRDGMLAITGELNRDLGGLPVKPEINMEVALQPRMIQFSIAPAYQPSRTPQERNRRSIYAYRVRGQADPFLEVFNQPNPNESCEARHASSVSPQAFSLLNSDLMTDRSIALALRLQTEATTVENQITRGFQLVFGRIPRVDERGRMLAYLSAMKAYHQESEPEPVVYPTRITRSLVEEFTGKPFEYKEVLPVFEDYVADKKAGEVSAETRALADMCLLLFNASEFLYVY
jgi:mono/diheme cytochrome c family protein